MTQILNRFTGNIITSGEMNLRELVIHAVKEKKVLRGADLTGAYLRGADLTGAYLTGAYLRGADLTGAYLRGAYLTGADLTGADLTGAYLRGADLTGAYLTGADLTGAYLRGADLTGAYLTGAYLTGSIKVKNCAVFTGIYQYLAMPIIAIDGTKHITLGCHTRTYDEWKSNFWNNPSEFPNNGDMKSQLRWLAYQTCLEWFKLHE